MLSLFRLASEFNTSAFSRFFGENSDAGAPGGIRTPTLDLRGVLLYPLSYRGRFLSIASKGATQRRLDALPTSLVPLEGFEPPITAPKAVVISISPQGRGVTGGI